MLLFVRRVVLAAVGVVIVLPTRAPAQEPVTITGQVTSDAGVPLALVDVSIPSIGVGGLSNEDGRYTLLVPGARVTAPSVTLRSSARTRATTWRSSGRTCRPTSCNRRRWATLTPPA